MSTPEPGLEMVDHPAHYNKNPSGVECIDVIEHMPFNIGNAVKYLWRVGSKGDPLEDLQKAAWYVDREISLRTTVHKRADKIADEPDEPEREVDYETYKCVMRWWLNGYSGVSSKAIAQEYIRDIFQTSHSTPRDGADFWRCVMFVESFPDARAAVERLGTAFSDWKLIHDNWQELTQALMADVGVESIKELEEFSSGYVFPRTTELLRKVLSSHS